MSLQFKLVGIEDYNKKVLIYKVKKDENGELSFTVNDIFNFIISLVGNKIDDALKLEKIKKEFKKIDLILAPAMGGIIIGYEIG